MPQVKIQLVDAINDRRLSVKLPDNVSIEELIPTLAHKLNLPEEKYELILPRHGRICIDENLRDSECVNGDTLILRKEILRTPPVPTSSSAEEIYTNGWHLFTIGEYRGAKRRFNKLIEMDPNCSVAYYYRGRCQQGLRKYEQALEDYTEALEGYPEAIDPQMGRAEIYMLLGQWQPALADLEQVLQIDPYLMAAIEGRAVAHLRMGQLQQASEGFTELLTYQPKRVDYLNVRSTIYEQLGQPEKAQEDKAKALELGSSLDKQTP